ncbi:YihY/virulence factor BrkB family protein [Blastococcus saxobsidens]|nr:YihY/virulence factor BrkB family protein [Blastococcus saxobsidens]
MSSSRTGDGPARKAWPARMWDRIESTVDAARRRSPWLDHLARAGGRYQRTQGDLMAAGVTYFAFLGLFPVLMLIASVIGLVLSGNELLQQELYGAIRDTFPGSTGAEIVTNLQAAVGSAGVVGLVGLVGFVYAGLRAMDKLRIGMERIWKGHPEEPEFLRDNVQDILALILLGALGVLSLGLTGVATWATDWLLEMLGLEGAPGLFVLTAVISLALAFAGDTVVFLWLLKVVPSTRHPLRRLLPGALFGAAGFEVLKLIGNLYLSLISGSVTASAFGGAVGILVWINIVFRFSFFTAAWTASLPALADAAPAAGATRIDAPDGDRSPAR